MDIQQNEINRWAKEHDHEIVGWWEDRRISGDMAVREGRDSLIAEAKKVHADGIVASDLSRWTREDALAAFSLLNELRGAGIEVKTVAEAWLDLSQPFAYTILVALIERNHQQLETTRANTRKGLRASQEAGTWIGRVPWGWQRVRELRADGGVRVPGKNYWIKPARPAEIRRLFEARAEGRSWAGIERVTGIRAASVREILTNEINRQVVSDELFDRAQRTGTLSNANARAYLLSGLLICPWCGRRMIGNVQRVWGPAGKTAHYRCKVWDNAIAHPWRAISERLVIRHLVAALERIRLSDADRAAVETKLRRSAPNQAALVKAHEKRVAQLEAKRRRVENGLAEGLIRPDRARQMLAEISDSETHLAPPPVVIAEAAANLTQLGSLPALIERARAAWLDQAEGGEAGEVARDVVYAANAVLREVVSRIEWPERRVKYRPRIVFAARYAAVIAVAEETTRQAARPRLRVVRSAATGA
ncbi:MAG TPA: recombinase family protein [Candidatus Limnocylindrales bacterium]